MIKDLMLVRYFNSPILKKKKKKTVRIIDEQIKKKKLEKKISANAITSHFIYIINFCFFFFIHPFILVSIRSFSFDNLTSGIQIIFWVGIDQTKLSASQNIRLATNSHCLKNDIWFFFGSCGFFFILLLLKLRGRCILQFQKDSI